MDNSLTTYTADEGSLGDGKAPVPPCILRRDPDGCQIAVEVEDRADKASVLKARPTAVV